MSEDLFIATITGTLTNGEHYEVYINILIVLAALVASVVLGWLIERVWNEERNFLLERFKWQWPESLAGMAGFILLSIFSSVVLYAVLLLVSIFVVNGLFAMILPDHLTLLYACCLCLWPLVVVVSNANFYIMRRQIENKQD